MVNIKVKWTSIIKVSILLLSIIFLLLNPSDIAYETTCFLTIINTILCILLIFQKRELSIKSAKTLFWAITLIFSLGQNLAYLFITDTSVFESSLLYGYKYSAYDMNRGTFYIIPAFNMFTLGLYSRKFYWTKESSISITQRCNTYLISQSAYYCGLILLIISFPAGLVYLISNILLFFSIGYGESVNHLLPGIILQLQYLFFPSLFIVYIGRYKLDKNNKVLEIIIATIGLIYLTTGDRGTGLSLFVALIWLKAMTDPNLKISRYLILGIFVVISIPIIKYYRSFYTQNSENALFEAISYTITNNPIVDLLLETGAQQRIIIMTMDKVAYEGFANGIGYLDFFYKMLPSGLGLLSKYANLDNWVINRVGHQTYGFSIWAEAYLNFGMMGILFMYLIGGIIKELLTVRNLSVFTLIRCSCFLVFFADISRRNISSFGYIFLYDYLMPLVMIYVISLFLFEYKRTRRKIVY